MCNQASCEAVPGTTQRCPHALLERGMTLARCNTCSCADRAKHNRHLNLVMINGYSFHASMEILTAPSTGCVTLLKWGRSLQASLPKIPA